MANTIDTVLSGFVTAATAYAEALDTETTDVDDGSRAAVIAIFAEFCKLVHDLNTGDKGEGETQPNESPSAARTASKALFSNVGAETQWLIEVIASHANRVVAELTAYAGGTAPGYSAAFDPADADWDGPDAPLG